MAGATRPQDKFRERPIAPHLQVWRWHITMATSILHRATGVALYGGAILFAAWLITIAAGAESYRYVGGLLASPVGQLGLYLLVAAFAFHLANGIRHFIFDTGAGLKPSDADSTAWFAILFAIAAPVGLWVLVTFGGLHR
ncbi:MAG: succinate dehydrogenase, cytochrome b556 subunit [Proteobacteria bacterium]|nr:succinate dehydrogenase, cytochrome b556 subunit [Pseudomonadota bacterium]